MLRTRVKFTILTLVLGACLLAWYTTLTNHTDLGNSQGNVGQREAAGSVEIVQSGNKANPQDQLASSERNPATQISHNDDTQHPGSPNRQTKTASEHETTKGNSIESVPWLANVDPVGIPFPVSDSIRKACKQMEHLGTASCVEHYAVLMQLEKESRDEKWAQAMAETISLVVATQPAQFIRAIDCRKTVCAVEIESTRGVFDRGAAASLKDNLTRVDRVYGYEKNDANELVTVTSMTLRRK